MTKHKEDCLTINGKQSVKLEKVTIEFENYFKQIPVPFKIYADFECNLKNVECYEGTYTKKYHEHVPCSYAYKVVYIDDKYSKSIVVYRGKNAAYEFIKAILNEYKFCKNIKKNLTKIWLWVKKKNIYFKKVIVVRFAKNFLIMTEKK